MPKKGGHQGQFIGEQLEKKLKNESISKEDLLKEYENIKKKAASEVIRTKQDYEYAQKQNNIDDNLYEQRRKQFHIERIDNLKIIGSIINFLTKTFGSFGLFIWDIGKYFLDKGWNAFIFFLSSCGKFLSYFGSFLNSIWDFFKKDNPVMRLLVFIIVLLIIIGSLAASGYHMFKMNFVTPKFFTNLGLPINNNNINSPSIQSKLKSLYSNNNSIYNNNTYNNFISNIKNIYQSFFAKDYISNNSIPRNILQSGGRCNDTIHIKGSDLLGSSKDSRIINNIYGITNADIKKTYSLMKPNDIIWTLPSSSHINFNNLPPEFIDKLELNKKLNIKYEYKPQSNGRYTLNVNNGYYSDTNGNRINLKSTQTQIFPLKNIDDSTCQLNI